MTRMCENGPSSGFGEASGGGPLGITLFAKFALRDVRPCIAQERQHYLLRSRRTFDVSLRIL